MQTGTEPAHKLLEYLITRATVSGKPSSSEIRLYYPDLAAGVGKDSSNEVDLVVKIELSWGEPIDFLEESENEPE